MRRGQISVDFLLITIFIFFVFLGLFQLYYSESSSARILESRASAIRIGNILARAINEVGRKNETGTFVVMPETLDTGDSYHLSIKASGRRVEVFWPISSQNRSIALPILTSNITELNLSKTAGSGSTTLYLLNLNGLVNVSVIT